MEAATTPQSHQIRRSITSLINKSEKALQKLEPGTWQHARLSENLRALHVASTLIEAKAGEADDLPVQDGTEVLRALRRMITTTAQACSRFAAGTSQHSLLRNRLEALRASEARIRMGCRDDKA